MFLLWAAFAVLVVGLCGWLGVRRVPAGASWVARLAAGLLGGALALLLLVLLAMLLFYVALTEPWPVAMRHGPDTALATELYEGYVGQPRSAEVDDVYAWRQWAGPGEHVLFLCFRARDPALVQHIVRRFRLQPVAVPSRSMLQGWEGGPYWWPEHETLQRAGSLWADADGNPQAYTHLWTRLGDGRTCLLEVDIA